MEHRKLCEAVEKEVGRTLSAPSDFKWLSAQVEKHTHERLSPSTLMRAWGYMDGERSSSQGDVEYFGTFHRIFWL